MLGRQEERHILRKISRSKKARLLAIIGRRRVGKTFLIHEHYAEEIVFEFIGTQYADKENQLNKFKDRLDFYNKKGLKNEVPESWADAFKMLKIYLQGLRKTKYKKVIFFDEFPWIAGHRSRFLEEFSYWWNEWASKQNLLVVICGSAASWMVRRVVNNRGGLHNRITDIINLKPFTLQETKEYIQSINPGLDHYQIIQIYMAIGGIPHYLQHLVKGESAVQAIDRLCFQKDGILRNEFQNLYAALFQNHERHVEVIRALFTKWKGLTRQEIVQATSISDGGGLTKLLEELVTASFVLEIQPFGSKRKKDTLYRLADEYSLFYLKFIEGERAGTKDVWIQRSNQHDYQLWRGYAFENICIKHAEGIKQALGVAGIRTNISSFLASNELNETVQIDMLIERADKVINLCEMKFYNDEFMVTKDYADRLRRRRVLFQEMSKTKHSVFNTLVTTYGLRENQHGLGQVDQVVSMDALFKVRSF